MTQIDKEARGLPLRGDFQWRAIAGGHRPSASDMSSERGYFGLELEGTYPYGTVRDATGELVTPMRRIAPPATSEDNDRDGVRVSLPPKLLLVRTLHGEYALDKSSRRSASSEGVKALLDGDAVRWDSPPGVEGQPFHVEWRPDALRWVEEGTIDLFGGLIGPGLHWYLPGRDAATYYVSHLYQVEGEVLGQAAEGFLCLDQAYMPPGGVLYAVNDAMVGESLELAWYTWATRWEDGSIEAGHFAFGHDKFGFAVFTNHDGSVTSTSDVAGLVTRSADGYWADHVAFDVAGVAWEFVPDPKGRMGALGRVPNPQQEGLMRRVGDTRKPKVWFAWGETVPAHGLTRRNRYCI